LVSQDIDHSLLVWFCSILLGSILFGFGWIGYDWFALVLPSDGFSLRLLLFLFLPSVGIDINWFDFF
jgi:hypothetical protein